MQNSNNAAFSQSQKSHYARTWCILLTKIIEFVYVKLTNIVCEYPLIFLMDHIKVAVDIEEKKLCNHHICFHLGLFMDPLKIWHKSTALPILRKKWLLLKPGAPQWNFSVWNQTPNILLILKLSVQKLIRWDYLS